MIRAAANLGGGLLGWRIATWWGPRIGWVFAALCISFAVAWSFSTMPTDYSMPHPQGEHPLAESMRALRFRSGLCWAIAAALVFNLVLPLNHFWAPFVSLRFGESALGFAWMFMQFPLIIAGQLMRRFQLYMKRRQRSVVVQPSFLAGSLLFAGVGMVGVATCGGWSVPLLCITLNEVARGFYEPFLEIFTHSRIGNRYRATYMSLQSFLAKCGGVVVLSAVWVGTRDLPANEATISLIWSVSGSLLVVCALVLWSFRPRT
jgi:hypothetical protein